MGTTIYYVEALEKGKVYIVPHDKKKKYYEFICRSQANEYLKGLVAANTHLQFRLCKRTTTRKEGSWIKYKVPF